MALIKQKLTSKATLYLILRYHHNDECLVVGQLAGMVVGGSETPLTDRLFVFPWQIYPDMVVFDWFIKLADKDRWDTVHY